MATEPVPESVAEVAAAPEATPEPAAEVTAALEAMPEPIAEVAAVPEAMQEPIAEVAAVPEPTPEMTEEKPEAEAPKEKPSRLGRIKAFLIDLVRTVGLTIASVILAAHFVSGLYYLFYWLLFLRNTI